MAMVINVFSSKAEKEFLKSFGKRHPDVVEGDENMGNPYRGNREKTLDLTWNFEMDTRYQIESCA